MPTSPANLAGPWAAPVAVTVVLACVMVLYGRGWYRLARETPGRVPSWCFGSFLAGLTIVWIAWTAWIAGLAHYLLIAHMVQHLLLALAAPPLLLLGRPGPTFLRAFERKPRETLPQGPAWARQLGSFLTHPVFAGLFMVAVTIGWHIPPVFKVAMGSPLCHEVENASFLVSGVLFWWPVILPWPSKQHWPRWTVPLYLLISDMPVSVLSAYLAFCGYVVYPAYITVSRPFAISALNDQVAAAMLMWVVMLVVFLVAAVAVLLEVLDPSWGHVLEIDESSRPHSGFARPAVARESAIGPGAEAARSVGSEGPA